MFEKFSLNDFDIERLNKDYLKNFDFNCNIKDLNEFLRDDAILQQDQLVNITYVWFLKDTKKLAGYITLSCDTIHLSGKKKEEMRLIGISYRALPALKIGRMAVNKEFFDRGLGTLMILFAINVVKRIAHFSGCRFITLESKNDSTIPESRKPVHFYKKMGFVVTKERKKTSYVPMNRDLYSVLKSVPK